MDRIASALKQAHGSIECVESFEKDIGRPALRRALVELQLDVQAQLTASNATLREATVPYLPDEQYRALQAEHASRRRAMTRFLSTISTSISHLKKKDREESEANSRQANDGDGNGVGWDVGAAVTTWAGVHGVIISAVGRSRLIEWETVPGVPFSYLAPWADGFKMSLEPRKP